MIDKWPGKKDSGQEYELPAGWTRLDLIQAASEMHQIASSRAWALYAHRIGHEQRRQASRAIPPNPASTTHEQKIQAGASYNTFNRVLTIAAEIASYKLPEEIDNVDQQESRPQAGGR
jgi:hypothetical protein